MSATEDLTRLLMRVPNDALRTLHERHGVSPSDGHRALVKEICLDGSNTIASLFRGMEGVEYDEVVRDVAEALGVKTGGGVEALESHILEHVLNSYLKNASESERADIERILDEASNAAGWRAATNHGSRVAIAALINLVGQQVVVGLVKRVILQVIAKQSAREAGKMAARTIGYAVPLLNVALLGWTAVDVAGPALRKTIPTVIEIALLRMEYGEDA